LQASLREGGRLDDGGTGHRIDRSADHLGFFFLYKSVDGLMICAALCFGGSCLKGDYCLCEK
jgi:hypothetical protein